MTTVHNTNRKEIDFDAAVNLMVDEIREAIAAAYEPGFDNPQAFIEEYARRHAAAFDGEGFEPFDGGAW